MKKKLYTSLKYLLGWPLSVLALVFIIKLIAPKSQTVFNSITTLNWQFLTFGISSFFIFYIIRGYIWYSLLKNSGYQIPLRKTLFLWVTSDLKRYIPGNIWAFVGRAVLFGEKGVSKKDIGKLSIIEAEIFVLSTICISLLSVPFLTHYLFPGIPQIIKISSYLIVFVGIIVYIFNKKITPFIPKKIKPIFTYIMPQIAPLETFRLLSISNIALIFFGLGYYFTSSAITFLHPQLLPQLIGLFSLTFLIGYLSFLTPAGFGVREGLLIVTLSKLMTTNIAGFIALFVRIILILSELTFVAIITTLDKAKGQTITKIETWLMKHKQETILIGLIIIYCIYFTIISFLRYENFYTGRFDLGNMAQTVWNTSKGRLFIFTNPNGTDNVSRLSFHADFLLILLAPFYYLWSDPKMLLLIQTITVALGAFFVYIIAKDILKNKNLSLLIAFLYLINPSVERSNIYDFHSATLATTFLLATYYFYRKRNYRIFLLFAFLAAITKEQVWIIIAVFGACIFWFQKRKVLGATIFISSLAICYYLISYAIPQSLGSKHFALSYYSDFGDSPIQIVKNIILSPKKTFSTLFEHSRINYLQQLFMPLGYLSLLTPWFLLFTLQDLIINLLSNNPQLHQIYYQYTATITPFLFISTIYSIYYLKKFFPKLPTLVIGLYLTIFGLTTAYIYGPLPGMKEANIDMITKPIQNKETINQYLNHIPKRYSVAASNNVGSHLSQRQNIYTLPLGVDKADIIVFLLTDSEVLPSLKAEKQLAQKLKNDPNYHLTIEKGPFLVFKKKSL